MYQLTAVYAHPEDPEAFLAHYRDVHVPLAAKMPNVREVGWLRSETPDGTKPPHFVVAVLRWDTREDALAALGSPEGEAAVADLANFAGAGVDIEFGELNTAS
jgi:uncharacterized protein (TIGR02118 family)